MKIALLGSTGSVGRQVLNVVDADKEKFKIVSLAAGKNADLLQKQIVKYHPRIATLEEGTLEKVGGVNISIGKNSYLDAIIEDADIIFIAVMGFVGFKAAMKAVELGKRVALCNKESLVCGGELITSLARLTGAQLIPVDSEHSAMWQCLGYKTTGYKNLILTASGGAFRDYDIKDLENVTASDALKHPNWKMGKKITIDCATMLNKGLEVIEAHWLFGAPIERIKVIIHPESVIHSMVEFEDNSVMAQLSNPNMAQPIKMALTFPKHGKNILEPLDFAKLGKMTFKELDHKKYPCFDIAVQSLKSGGTYPCSLSAAAEVLDELFIEGRIKFTEIASCLSKVMERIEPLPQNEENIVFADGRARELASEIALKR